MFDVKREVNNIVIFIKEYFKKNNLKGVVLGISGGKDSAVVAALFAKALGSENVLGVTLPCHSHISDKNDAKLVADKFSNINLKPRLRMASVYYLAALYSEFKGGTYIVAGTSNLCELYVGYFTKGGDSTYDIGVLNNYTVEEVIKMGEYLEVPDTVIHKAPSDGLSGMTDEDKLGVKYKDIASYINNEKLDDETTKKILKLHNNAHHKFNIPVYQRK